MDRPVHDPMTVSTWPEEHPSLLDERIALRPFAPTDGDAVFHACQDPLIQRWTRVPVPYRREDAEWFVGEFVDRQWQDGDGHHCAVVDRHDHGFLGACALMVVDGASGVAEAGYWVDPAHRGRGVATAALRLISTWGFDALGLARIELHVDPRNEASIAVGRRAGYEIEGTLRQRVRRLGEQRDVVMMSRIAAR